MRLEWGEVDGVRAVWVEDGSIPGPLQACLMFGVGRGDETMTVSGVTHLVEHLALHRLGTVPYGWNGMVTPVTTRFGATGAGGQIAAFFAHVIGELMDLPVDRLESEARVLGIEGDRHGAPQLGLDLSIRLGPQGAGLLGWPEHGLRRLQADDVIAWSTKWFTAQNAVLWLSGPVPPELRLDGLRRGGEARRDLPAPLPLQPRSWMATSTRVVSLSLISEQQWGVIPGMGIARQRAVERLRGRDAISYAIEYDHVRIGGGQALEYLQADGTSGSYRPVLDGLVEVLEELAESGPTTSELALFHDQREQLRQHHESALSHLDNNAERCLLGLPTLTSEELEEKLQAVTATQMRRELSDLLPTMLGIGPQELGEDLPGWSTVTSWSTQRVDGQCYEPILSREKGNLIVGSDGVSWALDEDHHRTIRWSDVVACFTWDNGTRHLVGVSGEAVYVVPWNWQGGHALTSLVDSGVEPARRIRMGEGDTQYRTDPKSPDSLADVRWLSTLRGALHGVDRVDLVIDTDGLFLLYRPKGPVLVYRPQGPGQGQLGLQELRSSDREALLGTDARNRWIPEHEIEQIEFVKNPLARINSRKGNLRIATGAAEPIRIDLTSDEQVRMARSHLQALLGSRFVG